jgi:hypothetical protein
MVFIACKRAPVHDSNWSPVINDETNKLHTQKAGAEFASRIPVNPEMT